MAMRDFEIANAAREVDEDAVLEFRLKDKKGKWTVYETHLPGEGQIALFLARTQDSTAKAYNAMLKFMQSNFLPNTYEEIIDRVEDNSDPLSMNSLVDVVWAIIEEASSTPTTGSSTSTSSQPKTGTGSRASTRAKASTSSPSRRAGS